MRCFLFCISLHSLGSFAQYHRFYRGYSSLDKETFIETVNKDFFPLFAQAAPNGLISYKPILLNEALYLNIPNEIVILTFKDEDTYKIYGTSDIGKTIRAAHGPVFDASRSNSLVPTPFAGKVSVESAYLMDPELKDLSKGVTGVLIVSEPYGANDITLKEVERIFNATGKSNIISLVSKDYVIEYLFAEDKDKLEKLRAKRCSQYKGAFKTSKFVVLNKHKIGERKLSFGEGMDLQW